MRRSCDDPIRLVLFVSLALACGGCSVYTNRPTRTYRVTGTLHWQGKPGPEVWIHGEAVPPVDGFVGGTGYTDHIQATQPYVLALPLEVKITSSSHGIRRVSGSPKNYRIWVEAPPGWQVTPKEYRVTKPTTNLDFTLRPIASKGP